jgi:hypothetical protein
MFLTDTSQCVVARFKYSIILKFHYSWTVPCTCSRKQTTSGTTITNARAYAHVHVVHKPHLRRGPRDEIPSHEPPGDGASRILTLGIGRGWVQAHPRQGPRVGDASSPIPDPRRVSTVWALPAGSVRQHSRPSESVKVFCLTNRQHTDQADRCFIHLTTCNEL